LRFEANILITINIEKAPNILKYMLGFFIKQSVENTLTFSIFCFYTMRQILYKHL
jgi:hypothetical protein